MPAELFRSVAVRRRSPGHKLGAVPLSIAAHVAVLVAAITIPLLATDVLPTPQVPMVMQIPPMPVVVVPAPPSQGAVRPARSAFTEGGAPVVAPKGIPDSDIAVGPANIPDVPLGDLPGSVTNGQFEEAVQPPPPPPPKVTEPVRPGGLIKMPAKIHTQPPVYPPMAIAARIQGIEIIEAIISTTGAVQDARVMRSPSPLLDQAALEAVRQWVFTPTLLNGNPVPVILTVTVEFKLQ